VLVDIEFGDSFEGLIKICQTEFSSVIAVPQYEKPKFSFPVLSVLVNYVQAYKLV